MVCSNTRKLSLLDQYMIKTDSNDYLNCSDPGWIPEAYRKEIGQFNVFRFSDFPVNPAPAKPAVSIRKGYFKIAIVLTKSRFHYGQHCFDIEKDTLVFVNPRIPYYWEPLDGKPNGFFCMFTAVFFKITNKEQAIFSPANLPLILLDQAESEKVQDIFRRMLTEMDSVYIYKYDLLRNYLAELFHASLRFHPETEHLHHSANSSARILFLFAELLERQFPVESIHQRIIYKSPCDFADKLCVHVNYLNKSVKSATGNTTSEIISNRIAQEAQILLKQTSWNIAEIAWCLGFNEPNHFTSFFKKKTLKSPKAYREV